CPRRLCPRRLCRGRRPRRPRRPPRRARPRLPSPTDRPVETPARAGSAPAPRKWPRWQTCTAALGLAAFGLACLHPTVREIITRWDVAAIKERLQALGPWAWVYATFLMVLQAIVSVLPAFVVTIADGLVFGWLWG